jgi:hypothetical protein
LNCLIGAIKSQEFGHERYAAPPSKRFEQRWASRLTRRAASNARKNVGTKSRTINNWSPRAAANTKEKPAGVNRRPDGNPSVFSKRVAVGAMRFTRM